MLSLSRDTATAYVSRAGVYASSHCCMCPRTATYVFSYLLHICSHAGILHIRFLIRLYVSSYCYMCPHTVSRYSHLTCHPLSNTHTVGRRGGQEEEQEQGAPYDSRTSPLAIQQVQRERERRERERRERERVRETHKIQKLTSFFFPPSGHHRRRQRGSGASRPRHLARARALVLRVRHGNRI